MESFDININILPQEENSPLINDRNNIPQHRNSPLINNRTENSSSLNNQKEPSLLELFQNLQINTFINKEDAEDLICSICGNIPNPDNANEVVCCGHLFCKPCLENWLLIQSTCPLCKGDLSDETLMIKDLKLHSKLLYRKILKYKIKCPCESCDWIGSLNDFIKHSQLCTSQKRCCKYKDIGCTFKGNTSELSTHEENNDKLHLMLAMTKFNGENKGEIRRKVRIHPHPLIFRKSYSWICSGEEYRDKCRAKSAYDSEGPRFMCEECKFDLCNECFLYYMEK